VAAGRESASAGLPGAPHDVLTYHADAQRTGWYSNETRLNVGNVSSHAFGLLHVVRVDGRVDAQPLVVNGQNIAGVGKRDAVYVATEKDAVYAIDAATGIVLWNRVVATPVPDRVKGGNRSVYPVVGILGTPVIDRGRNALYFVADSFDGGQDTFVLHRVALDTGADLVPPVAVSATARLADGTTWQFDARAQFQRPGLLEANSSIYVAFGSNSDVSFRKARGIVLRYDADTLSALGNNVTNRLSERVNPFYLTSIWQSGFAPALGDGGAIFFSTGNSNPNRGTHSREYNHPEAVLKLPADLSRLVDSFTPSNYATLDANNADLGSGGTMIVPAQPGRFAHMVVAGGKDGRTFLLDADDLGGYHRRGDRVLAQIQEGACWCGPAFFVGSDGSPRVLTGGALGATSWRLLTGQGKPALALDSSTGPQAVQGLPENGGVIPVVSSDGTRAGTAVVWFVQRPQSTTDREPGTPVTLQAYDAMDLRQRLFAARGGYWRHAVGSNANVVPTVAGGKVFVASDGELRIFGLASTRRDRGPRRP
jgi:hypothetical protein